MWQNLSQVNYGNAIANHLLQILWLVPVVETTFWVFQFKIWNITISKNSSTLKILVKGPNKNTRKKTPTKKKGQQNNSNDEKAAARLSDFFLFWRPMSGGKTRFFLRNKLQGLFQHSIYSIGESKSNISEGFSTFEKSPLEEILFPTSSNLLATFPIINP